MVDLETGVSSLAENASLKRKPEGELVDAQQHDSSKKVKPCGDDNTFVGTENLDSVANVEVTVKVGPDDGEPGAEVQNQGSLDSSVCQQADKGDTALKKKGRGKGKTTKVPASAKPATTAVPAPGPGAVSANDLVKLVPVEKKKIVEECVEGPVLLSKTDKAAQIQLSSDQLTAKSEKGYKTARATHGIKEGCWYCEVKVEHLGDTGHVRLGWATAKADLQAPVGCCPQGYAYRDLEGVKVHNAVRTPYGDSFGEGDVVGMYISLPKKETKEAATEGPPEEHVLLNGQAYTVANTTAATKTVPIHVGSAVAFSLNGKLQGVAFTDLTEGKYYPAASLYTMPNVPAPAAVTFNFGPDFAYPLSAVGDHLPSPRPFSALSSSGKKPDPTPSKAPAPEISQERHASAVADLEPPLPTSTDSQTPDDSKPGNEAPPETTRMGVEASSDMKVDTKPVVEAERHDPSADKEANAQ